MPNIPDGHPHPFILLLVALMILTPFAGADHMIATLLLLGGATWLIRRFRAKAQKT